MRQIYQILLRYLLTIALTLSVRSVPLGDLTIDLDSNSLVSDKFNISWFVPTNSTIIFNIRTSFFGYLGLSYKPSMFNADMSVIEIINKEVVVRDYWSDRQEHPRLDAHNDIRLLGSDTDWTTFIQVKFERPLDSQDPQDNDLSLFEARKIAVAWGDSPTLVFHGPNIKYFEIPIANRSVTPYKLNPGVDEAIRQIIQKIFPDMDVVLVHGIIMTLCWCFLAMVGIFISFYRYKKYTYLLHPIIFTIVCLGTWANVGTLIGYENLLKTNIKTLPPKTKVHLVLGVFMLGWIAIHFLLAFLMRTLTAHSNAHPKFIRTICWGHRVLGLSTIILGQINCLVGWWLFGLKKSLNNQFAFWIVFSATLVLWILFIVRKFTFSRISQNQYTLAQAEKTFLTPQKIEKIKRLPYNSRALQDLPYIIFNNHIWDLSPLFGFHPAGNQIIDKIRGREVDRFIYGMYSPEYLFDFTPYAHSFKSMQLLGAPISKLHSGPALYIDETQYSSYTVSSVQEFSSNHAVVFLKPVSGQGPKITNPTDLSFLGQHYTIHGFGVSRLYTLVHSLQQDNRKFVQFVLKKEDYFNPVVAGVSTYKICGTEGQTVSAQQIETYRQIQTKTILPLIMKSYTQGKFTSKLFQLRGQQILVSTPMGKGMTIKEVPPGNISLVAGGTGFYPFIDLIDLLFKQTLLTMGRLSEKETDILYELSPVLRLNSLSGYSFRLFLALHNVQDIHPLHLCLLKYVADKNPGLLKVYLRIKNKQNVQTSALGAISIIGDYFDESFIGKYGLNRGQSMVYICGPPQMNYDMQTGFNMLKNDPSTIFFL